MAAIPAYALQSKVKLNAARTKNNRVRNRPDRQKELRKKAAKK